jgi:hypothetical protein
MRRPQLEDGYVVFGRAYALGHKPTLPAVSYSAIRNGVSLAYR